MKNRKLIFTALTLIAITATGYIYFTSAEDPEDKALFEWISSQTDYSYYKNSPEIRRTSKETELAHDNYMRTKFNRKTLSVLDSAGKLPNGVSFPDSSIIVKEIYSDNDSTSLNLYAVMVKLAGDKNSGKDWLWAEFTPKGEAEYSVTSKGKACVKCHNSGDDHVRILGVVK